MVFDVLHQDGAAVRELPYLTRRQLLDELALDAPCCRTPANFVGSAAELASATAEQGLEGIVAKRLSSTWLPGRRSASWVKTKHRRRERLLITGWRTRTDEPEEFLVARAGADGRLQPAGSVWMGLDRDRRATLLEALASAEDVARRRGSLRFSTADVEVAVDCHGRLDGPVRDAVVREVHVDGEAATTGDAST